MPGQFVWLRRSDSRVPSRVHVQLDPLRVRWYRSTIDVVSRRPVLRRHEAWVGDSLFVLRGIQGGNLLSAERRPAWSGNDRGPRLHPPGWRQEIYLPGWRQDMTFRDSIRLVEATPHSLNLIVSKLRESAMYIVRSLPEADWAGRVALTRKTVHGTLVDSFETTAKTAVEQLNAELRQPSLDP